MHLAQGTGSAWAAQRHNIFGRRFLGPVDGNRNPRARRERGSLRRGAGDGTAFSILSLQVLMVAPLLFTYLLLGASCSSPAPRPIISDLLWTIAPAFFILALLVLVLVCLVPACVYALLLLCI